MSDLFIPGHVYLLHFDEPISDNHTTQHYLGWTNNLDRRIRQHRAGADCRLTQVAKERNINFRVARTWVGFRSLEKALKRQHNSPRLCPICMEAPMNQPSQPTTTEYDKIYALVVRLDDDLAAGRVYFRRVSDGELLTRLELVVPAILAGDIAPCKPAGPVGPPWSIKEAANVAPAL